MSPRRAQTRTGGRDATTAVIPGRYALSVGRPSLPAPEGWTWIALTDVARLETGHTPSRKNPEYWVDGAIPWIGIRDATGNHGRVIRDTAQHTNELGIANSSARVLPEHTVCLSRTASVGFVVVMGRPMATSQDFVNWVCSEELDWRFLKYVLLAEQDSLRRFAHGTTHQTIYFPEVKAFHVCAPEVAEQKRIAWVLGTLDAKIEANAELAQVAEVLAGLRFRQTVRELESPDANGIAPGWTPKSIAELARYINGKAFTKHATGDGLMMVRIAELKNGPGPSTAYGDVVAEEDNIAYPGDMLFAWSGSLDVYRWCRDKALINQHIFKVIPQCLPDWFVFYALKLVMPRFQAIAADKATTMGHIKRSHLSEHSVVVPPADVIEREGVVLRPLYDLALAARRESFVLAALRDELLPKLISGQIRVPEDAVPAELVEAGAAAASGGPSEVAEIAGTAA